MPLASDALRIARRAIDAVEPGRAVRTQLRLVGDRLRVARGSWSLPRGRSVHLVAFGKAAARMYGAAWDILASRVAGGIVVLRDHDPPPEPPAQVFYGEHPVPGSGSVRAGRAVLAYLRSIPGTQSVLFLISGGGSSLLELPAIGIRLSDITRTTQALLGSGAPIQAMNIVRRHLSQIKGGGLARSAGHCRFASMAISDVVGDAPEDIASGPTVADPSSFLDALGVIRRYRLADRIPKSVMRQLKRGASHETGGRIPTPPGVFSIVARNADAVRAAAKEARRLRYRAVNLGSHWTGDTARVARSWARRAAKIARGTASAGRRICLVGGGETTVTLTSHPGVGGRNQEFVLHCARALAGLPAVVLSIGTDGVDGPTDAAGGWVDGHTLARAQRLGVNIAGALHRHDAYRALDQLGGLIRTGPTGTNVTDLHVLLVGERSRTGGSNPRSGAPSSPRRRS